MNTLRTVGTIIGSLFLFMIHIQCAGGQQLDMKNPLPIKEAYFQKVLSGIKGGTNGFMMYVELKDTSGISLNYAYFKGKKVKLAPEAANKAVYIGHYMYPQKINDLIMSSDPKEEFKNKPPGITEKIPFELKEGECVIEYTKDNKQDSFKLDNLPEKPLKNFPM